MTPELSSGPVSDHAGLISLEICRGYAALVPAISGAPQCCKLTLPTFTATLSMDLLPNEQRRW